MSKVRVHVLAKEIGMTSKDLIEKLNSLNINVANHMSSLDENEVFKVKQSLNKGTGNKTAKVDNKYSNKRDNTKKKETTERKTYQKRQNTNRSYVKDNQKNQDLSLIHI